MKIFRVITLLVFSTFASNYVLSQQITNVRAQLQGDNIIINYDLISDNPDAVFDIKVYGSHNNFTTPISQVSGDVGPGVKPGTNKTITWRAKSELNTYTGNISFEVRGLQTGGQKQEEPQEIVDPNKLVLSNPRTGDKFKYGTTMGIRWKGGLTQDVKIELYQNNTMLRPIQTVPNTGTYNWPVPKEKALKGSNYSLKLFNVNQPESAVFSGTFRIKGKTSVVVYILPAVVVGGGVAALLLLKKPTPNNNLPEPPSPDSN